MNNCSSSNNVLTINLGALADNYRLFEQHTAGNSSIAGIVKANAYGLGLKKVSQKLTNLDCSQFFVATLDEALELRAYDNKTPIAVLGGLAQNIETNYLTHNITPVLNTQNDIKKWQELALKQHTKLKTILHFDTAMNRLGLSVDDAYTLINDKTLFNALNIQIVMSHFACADEKDHPLTQQQADLFAKITAHFPDSQKSLANSSGLFRDNSYHFDLVRPGYALYGGNPTPETQNPMQPVVSLNTPILQTRNCKKGESIGYGATHIFNKDTRTATVAIGYADGFLRSNSSKAILYYNNQPCPVLGRVSMDLVTIDISQIQGQQPQQDDPIEVLGPNQSIDNLAKNADTIGYEILTSLGHRYKREYI